MKGAPRDAVTLVALLKSCTQQKDLHRGIRIHTTIVKEGFLLSNVFIGSSLVNMYAKCGALAKAQEVFNELPTLNIISWNALISGYAQHGHGQEALICFERMQHKGFSPDAVTFTCLLKACGSIGALEKGQEIHTLIMREHLLEIDIMVGGALVDMYGKCGAVEKAQEVFDELPVHDIVSWTALITGYAQSGHGEEALMCFKQMQLKGFSPDAMTYSCILKACGSIGAPDKGEEIHSQIVRNRLLGKDIVVANALVDMYAKCGALEKAKEVFDEIPWRDIVSWNALIAGYAHHGYGEEALDYFDLMQQEGLSPDAFTLVCVLKACGGIGAAYRGLKVHADVVKRGMQEGMVVSIPLVVMYANCCMLAEAQKLFDNLAVWDVVSWTALMEGYAQLGNDDIVINLLRKMMGEGIEPTPITLTIILNTCNHTGLLDVGQMCLDIMSKVYDIISIVDHYTCMVDLFGRVGHLDKALLVVQEMPFLVDLTVWHTLLGACIKWGNIKLGKWAFEHAVELDEKSVTAYVYMRNIYAAAGKQEDANKIEAMQVQRQAWKTPGHDWWP